MSTTTVAPFFNQPPPTDGGVQFATSSPAGGATGGAPGIAVSESNGVLVTYTPTSIGTASFSAAPSPPPVVSTSQTLPATTSSPQTFATSTSSGTLDANVSPTNTAPTSTSTAAPSSGGSGVSATTIVAILVPILVVLALIPIAYIIWLRRRTKRAEKAGPVTHDTDDSFGKSESKLTIDNADAAAAPKTTTVPLLEKQQQTPSFSVSEVKPSTGLAVGAGGAALGVAAAGAKANGNPYAQTSPTRAAQSAKSGFIPPIFGQQPRRGTNTSNMSHFTGRSSSDVERIPLTSTSRSNTPGRPVTPLANSPSSFHTANGNTSETNVSAPFIPAANFTQFSEGSFSNNNRDSWPLPSRTAAPNEVQNFARPTVQSKAKPPAPLSAIGAPSSVRPGTGTNANANAQLPVLQTTQPSPPNFLGAQNTNANTNTSPSTATNSNMNSNTTAPKSLTSTSTNPTLQPTIASPVSPLSRTSSIAFPSSSQAPPIPTNLTNPSFLSSDPNPASRYDLSRHTNRDSDAVSAISMLSGDEKDENDLHRRKSVDTVSVISALSDDEKRR